MRSLNHFSAAFVGTARAPEYTCRRSRGRNSL